MFRALSHFIAASLTSTRVPGHTAGGAGAHEQSEALKIPPFIVHAMDAFLAKSPVQLVVGETAFVQTQSTLSEKEGVPAWARHLARASATVIPTNMLVAEHLDKMHWHSEVN